MILASLVCKRYGPITQLLSWVTGLEDFYILTQHVTYIYNTLLDYIGFDFGVITIAHVRVTKHWIAPSHTSYDMSSYPCGSYHPNTKS